MKNRFFLVVSLLLFVGYSALSQSSYLEVVCFVETQGGDPIKTAKAELYDGNTKVKTANSDLKGKISFNLDYNKNYKIIVTKQGMIQKRIDFNTNVAAEDQRNLMKEFAMSLVEGCEGADVSVFSEPVDIIKYDVGFGNFVSDESHFSKMQAKFGEAYRKLEKCKDDKFQNKKAQADAQFKQGNFEEAKEIYKEALAVYPNDGYTKRQIAASNKGLEKQVVNNQRYEQAIKEADQFLAQNNLNAAKQRYAEAARFNPSAGYPQEKITEINNLVATQAAALQQQQAINNQYNDLVKQANAAMAIQNYPMAQQLFQKAGTLKPNDAFANQKVAEVQQAIQKQKDKEAENARIDKAYQEAIAAGSSAMQQAEYIKAQEYFQSAVALKPSESLPRLKINEAQKLEAQRKANLLAAQKAEVDARFNEAIALADGLLGQQQYSESISAYKQAMQIKPSDTYAQAQIVKAQNLMVEAEQAKQVAIEKQYADAMALGNSNKLSKNYEEAISAYQQALVAKPNDALASSSLSEAQKLLADKQRFDKEEQETRASYNQLVQEGDGFFQSHSYIESKAKYQQALVLYATEQYPKNQIAKIDNIIAKNKKETEYDIIITEADGLFDQKSWEAAKAKYTQASQVIPENEYPRQRINAINQQVSNSAKAAIEEEYNKLASQAEQQVQQKNFEQAKAIYQQAMAVMPENPYSQQRINEINQLAADNVRQEKLDSYNKLIAEADGLFDQKSWEASKAKYTQASQVIPENEYPQQRINAINQQISNSAKSAIEEEYNKLVSQAEQQVQQKNYEQAKAIYQQAMVVMPENPYSLQRINEINQLITDNARQSKLDTYNQLIVEADNSFDNKNYEQAKAVYSRASQVLPTETYPGQRINEINQLLSNNTRQAVVANYSAAVAKADGLFASKSYKEASKAYSEALTIMPEQEYPQKKINEINSILIDQARIQEEQSSLENRYNQTIALADKYFNDRNYPLAISEYTKAISIKSGNPYPVQQIDKINDLVAREKEQEANQLLALQKYREVIAKADLLFKSQDYSNAKNAYQDALTYKEGDVHATSQIKRIEEMSAKAANAEQRKQQQLEQYNKLITNADAQYSANKLIPAKNTYTSALSIIPGQDYPRSQIRKIEEKLRIIAANQAAVKIVSPKPVATAAATTPKATVSNKKIVDNNFKSESERKSYLEDLKSKYKIGVTKEVYKDKSSTTTRYIVYRNDEIKELREIKFNWGGAQYKLNGKPTNALYFKSQVKPREGESYTEK